MFRDPSQYWFGPSIIFPSIFAHNWAHLIPNSNLAIRTMRTTRLPLVCELGEMEKSKTHTSYRTYIIWMIAGGRVHFLFASTFAAENWISDINKSNVQVGVMCTQGGKFSIFHLGKSGQNRNQFSGFVHCWRWTK